MLPGLPPRSFPPGASMPPPGFFVSTNADSNDTHFCVPLPRVGGSCPPFERRLPVVTPFKGIYTAYILFVLIEARPMFAAFVSLGPMELLVLFAILGVALSGLVGLYFFMRKR